MKRTFLLLVLALSLSLLSSRAQTTASLPLISVSGSAEVKVAPDEVLLRVGVESRHVNLQTAKQENDSQITNALAFLKKGGVRERDVQTDHIDIEPNYDFEKSRTVPVFYAVRKTIEIKLTDLTKFEQVLTGLLTNGVNHVHGIEFRTSNLRKHRDAARAMAIKAAKEKAEALAGELDMRCGRAHTISANEWGGTWNPGSGYWGRRYGSSMTQNAVQYVESGAAQSNDGTLSIGQISVSASVNVSFLLE